MQNVSFGARLLTPPEKFIKKTDTPEEAAHIIKHLKKLKRLIESPKYESKSAGDTVELKRLNAKNKFTYKAIYTRANTGEVTPIHMETAPGAKNFHWFDLFEQITNVVAIHNKAVPDGLFFEFKDVLNKLFSA